jgi:hypothetical protein
MGGGEIVSPSKTRIIFRRVLLKRFFPKKYKRYLEGFYFLESVTIKD